MRVGRCDINRIDLSKYLLLFVKLFFYDGTEDTAADFEFISDNFEQGREIQPVRDLRGGLWPSLYNKDSAFHQWDFFLGYYCDYKFFFFHQLRLAQ